MTKRDNILRALRRQQPEHIPFGFTLCDSLRQEFTRRTGEEDYIAYYDFDYRYVSLAPTRHPADYSAFHPVLPPGTIIDEWGIGHEPGEVAHFSKMLHPMLEFETPEQIRDFPVPDITAEYRYASLAADVADIQEAGYAAIYSAVQLFEPAWYWRGLENFLCDMLLDEDMVEAAMEKITAPNEILCRRLAEANVDIIIFGDDVGTQRSLMMDIEQWRKWVKPYTKRVIDAAKRVKPDLLAYYHSDGMIDDVVPEFIEIGVDILNPVQPECMDPATVKETYGDRLAFWGTVGTQTTMPFGTPEEVRRVVAERIETVGKGGGLVIAPTHILEPEIPWANIEAFVDVVRYYNA